MFRRTTLLATLALALGLSLAVADHAEARRGFSFGSRGTRTYQAPPPTTTAPSTAPIQRSTTPQTAPSAATRSAPRPSMFGSGLGGSLMRGLFIGGLIGLLLGHGVGGLAGVLGLLIQVGLLVFAAMLVLRLLRGPQPVPAGPYGGGRAAPSFPGGAAPRQNEPPRPGPTDEVGITAADLNAFERLLGTIQVAFSAEDEATLNANTTPEVFAFLKEELEENRQRGVRNQVSDVKLLQGDLAEAWREGARDYATVAMRYESRDSMVDRASGRILSGDREGLGQSTEVWTFARDQGGDWKLSAIQGA